MEELLVTLTEDEVLEQSKNSVRTIADNLLKTRAYYNALAANAFIHYLEEQGLLHGDIVNLHSSSKMLVDFEIADIQLPNLHIDVRAVFDEKEIFIPKKHFENKILPDVYLVMKMDDDLTNGTLLGFVEPAKINKQNQNDEYYFVNKSILTSPDKLVDLIKTLPVKQQYMISESADSAIEKLIMLYMDHDIDDVKLEKLIDYLKNSVIAREKLVEFENFERLSYMALQEFKNLDVENNDFSKYIKTLVTTDEFSEFEDKSDDLAQLFGEETEPQTKGLFVDEVVEPIVEEVLPVEEPVEDFVEEPAAEEEIEVTVEDIIEEEPEAIVEEIVEETPAEEPETTVLDEFDAFETVDEFDIPDELLTEEEPLAVEETVVEEVLPVEEPMQEEIVDEAPAIDEVVEEIPEVETVDVVTEPEIDDSVITEEDIADVSETLNDSLAGEDLELHVEGLEDFSTEENVELSDEHLEVSLETPEIEPEDIINEIEPEKEEPQELDVAQALDLEEVNLDSETVIGLSEGVMDVDNVEELETVEETVPEETLSIEELDNIQFEEETPVQDEVETVTDEEVDNAIAQSQAEETEEKKEDSVNADLDILMSPDSSSDADDLSLEELLSMENDLSADEPAAFHFDETDEEEQNPDAPKPIAATSEELEMLSADLDADPEPVLNDTTPEMGESEDEDISDFAFAVDSKPQGAGKNILIPVAALVTVLGIAGAGAWYFLSHGKSSGTNVEVGNTGSDIDFNDITPAAVEDTLTTDIQLNEDATAKQPPAPVKAPEPAAAKAPEVQVPPAPAAPEVKPEPLTIQKIKKDFSQPNTYLSVSKIVWDVPEYLTYNDDFNNYLQTLGSTLKLNLSSDLLLISENTVFNKVKVKIGLKDSGKKYSAEIEEGCGTKSVDDLVLQSVKNTLNLLKPPVNSLETADEDLYITIYL